MAEDFEEFTLKVSNCNNFIDSNDIRVKIKDSTLSLQQKTALFEQLNYKKEHIKHTYNKINKVELNKFKRDKLLPYTNQYSSPIITCSGILYSVGDMTNIDQTIFN